MNWNNGFSARYYLSRVDPVTWRNISTNDLTGGSVSRASGDLMESADLEMTSLPGDGEIWIRVWLDARQEGEGAHEALFTGLMSAPSVNWDGNRKSYQVECYSVLKPAADILLDHGWYAPADVDGAKLAAELLAVGAAPVTYGKDAPRLSSPIIAEDGETNLTMAKKILDAIGWRIRITGRGLIEICPKAEVETWTFDPFENDSVELSVQDKRDWFSCPNVFRAVMDDLSAIARDDSPDSELSTVSRGREVWMEERDCKTNSGESIAEYAARRLKEEQAPARNVSYTHRYCPELSIGDIVGLRYPAQNIDGKFRITTQRIELGYGARTSEEAVMV